MDYSERKARAGIRAIPDGRYTFAQDFDTSLWPDILPLVVTVEVEDDELWFDFEGCPPQTRSGLNMVFTMLQAMRVLRREDADRRGRRLPTPAFTAPIHISAPLGSIVQFGCRRLPFIAVTMSAQRLADMMLAALAPAIPDRVLAARPA